MPKAFHLRDNVGRPYVSRKEGGSGLTGIEDNIDASIQQRLHSKARRTDYSHQKQYWQHEDQQNDNNKKTKVGRKTTLWAF